MLRCHPPSTRRRQAARDIDTANHLISESELQNHIQVLATFTMRLYESLFATCLCLAQVSFAALPLSFTKWPTTLRAGEPATVTWAGDIETPATITLRKGSSTDLGDVQVLTAKALGGTFTFTPDDSLPGGADYALQISQPGQVNYSGHITLEAAPAVIPPSKGPRPTPVTQDPNSEDFETATHDEKDDDIPKGNNGETVSLNETTPTKNTTSGKSAMAAQMQTGGAMFRNTSPELLLAAAGIIFYLTSSSFV
ncbi:GPI anchored serine-threonine rich family protein [Aspergillus affinis]|uniref:GPI anchored serine-threonine rich family protein n=1 Tax=Aspergillus affinis TaxID=1070780 RepID=UPI0022FEDBB6|nr:uncharacterized protein KD926_011728 [Aspergillus affinis]KAI9044757.1 hypothetical protein KD926_011728 [Aspergillus affinis]